MNDRKKYNEISLPENEDFYSHLYMKNITDADYRHAKRVSKDIKVRNVGWYLDLHVQSDTLLLDDLF